MNDQSPNNIGKSIDTIEVLDNSDYCHSGSTTQVTEDNKNNQNVVDIEERNIRDSILEDNSGNFQFKGSSYKFVNFIGHSKFHFVRPTIIKPILYNDS